MGNRGWQNLSVASPLIVRCCKAGNHDPLTAVLLVQDWCGSGAWRLLRQTEFGRQGSPNRRAVM